MIKKEKELKLSRQIGKITSLVLVTVFIILISVTVVITTSTINSLIDVNISESAKGSAEAIQNMVVAAELAAADMESYLQKAYDRSAKGFTTITGKSTAKEDERKYYSSLYGTEITELSADVEKYITETARTAVDGNDNITGMGIMFEPKSFDESIESYSFYFSKESAKVEEITPFGKYEDYKQEAYYKKAADSKKPVFTEPYLYEGITMITFAVPILYNDELKGVIMADINVNNFEKTVTKNEMFPSMYTTIYNEDYIDIYDSAAPEDIGVKMDAFYQDAGQLQSVKEGMSKGETFVKKTNREDGRSIVRYFYPINAAGNTWWAMTALDSREKNQSAVLNIVIMVIISVVSLLTIEAVLIAVLKRKLKPIDKVVEAARNISEGNLAIEISSGSNDEIGRLAGAFGNTIKTLNQIISDVNYILSEMAAGNFAVRTKAENSYVGDFRDILMSVRKLNRTLSDTLVQIVDASEQVSLGAGQMASSAQSLAEGATDQAGAVEELQATVTNMAEQMEVSAGESRQSYQVAHGVEGTARESSTEMRELTSAMEGISSTASKIGDIIEEIEDIATQTNLLSLNAAIEAARAGEAGKGFAVVADQIRKLAADSASAAVNTRNLIETTIQQIKEGNNITLKTADSLEQVIQGVELLAENAQKSSDTAKSQSDSMRQINQGMEQISGVVQSNSAVAEETSATSEELSAQAVTLNDLVAMFQLEEQ